MLNYPVGNELSAAGVKKVNKKEKEKKKARALLKMSRLDAEPVADESMGKMSSKEELFLVLKQNGLMILTLFGVVLGFGLGFGLRRYDLSDTALMWLGNK